ncbi:hypothetical protein HDF16_000120 [Granulicella aggregans]|uniref:DUF4440 domain-containing protein n=1 Tax=Granulicella aggregans TaxID=474949 RepID=A0A7W7Z9W7_9BACT|nr:nuclear transport factor 2 family protein [Granulicella aggregans]MBB5055451.1 hypothetical protein [Granulicella aggregans]
MASISRVFTAAVLSFALVPISHAQVPADDAALQKGLQVIADDFMLAWQKQDKTALSSFLAPEFIFAGPGGYRSRAVTLNGLGHCELGTYTLKDFEMRRTSAESAVLLYKIHRDLTCGGEKELANTINADAFLRRDGKWLMVMTTEIVVDKP